MSDFSNNNVFSSLQPSNNEINNILVIMNNILEQNNIISNEEIPLINEEEDFPDDLPDLISDTFDPSGGMTIQIMNRINSGWNRRSAYIPFLNATSSFIYSPSNVLFRSFNEDKAKYKHILSEKGKEQIKIVQYFKEKFPNQSVCLITQDSFEEEQEISILPCKHIFTTDAIMHWVEKENASCPKCRFKLNSIEKEIEITSSPPVRRTRTLSVRNILEGIERRQEQQEEADIQRAIMASLRD